MAIAYLSGSERPTAAKMNALWTALDAKLTSLLSGKSPLILVSAHPQKYAGLSQVWGRKFFFLGAGPKHFTQAMPDAIAYDHSVYTDAIAAATIEETHAPSGIARVSFATTIDLDASAEAHKISHGGQTWWIRQTTAPRATRRSKYGCAEYIFEGQSVHTIPANYDRYSFVRLHNLNRSTLTVTFDGANPTEFTVPPLGIMAVSKQDGVWAREPYNYLWEVYPGDPRTYHLTGDHQGNNVVTPSIAFVWVSALITQSRSAFGWRVDPTVAHDLDGYDDLFGDPDDPQTKLVDLMRHKGQLLAIERIGGGAIQETVIEYDKDDNLSSKLAPLGILRNGNELSHASKDYDLAATGTNLLKSGETPAVFVELPFTLEESLPLDSFTTTPSNAEPTEDRYYYDLEGNQIVVSRKVDRLEYEFAAPAPLSLPGSRVLDYTNALAGYTSATAHLGVNGWYWEADLEIPRLPGLTDLISDIEISDDEQGKLWYDAGSSKLKYTRRHTLGRHGFAENIGTFGGVPRRWHSPRVPMRLMPLSLDLGIEWYDDQIDGWTSSDVETAPDGGDVDITSGGMIQTTVGILGPIEHASNTIQSRVWPEHYFPADSYLAYEFLSNYQSAGWYENNRSRLLAAQPTRLANGIIGPNGLSHAVYWPLQREHYNHIAWRINSVTRCRPLQLWDIYLYIQPSPLGLYDNGLASTFRPKNQFLRIYIGDDSYNQAQELGITIRNYNQLPTNFQNIRSQQHYSTNWFYRLRTTTTGGSVTGGGSAWYGNVTKEAEYDNAIFGSGQSQYVDGYFDHVFYRPFDLNDEYYWLAVEDVKLVSDALGLEFLFTTGIVNAHKLVTSSTAPTPTFLFDSFTPWTEQSSVFTTEVAAQAWVDDRVGDEETSQHQFNANRQFVRMVPAQTVDEIEWISDVETDLVDYRGESVDINITHQSNLGNVSYFDLNHSLEVRQVDAGEWNTKARLVWGDVDEDSYAFWVPKRRWIRQTPFAGVSIAQAAHVAAYGEYARPVSMDGPDLGSAKVESVLGNTVFRAHGSPSSFELVLFDDLHIDLTT